jgi:hypothetical protein
MPESGRPEFAAAEATRLTPGADGAEHETPADARREPWRLAWNEGTWRRIPT